MTDEQETPIEELKGRKVIEGGVAAQAGAAGVAVNEPARFTVKEVVHHRYACNPDSGQELERHSMIEFVVTGGTQPERWSKFQGLGILRANTPPPPQGMGQVRREYRFNIYADSATEAWEKFEEYNKRGAKQAEDTFRREFAEWSREQQQRLAVVQGPGAAQVVLGPDGRPVG